MAYRWYDNRLVNNGRAEEAVAAMKTAIDNNPTNIFHHRIYGWVLYLARRYDEAIEERKRVVEMDPGFVSAYDNLWLAYHTKGDSARAFEWFMKYHEQAHTSSELIDQLNAAYQNSGWQGVLQRQRGSRRRKRKRENFRHDTIESEFSRLSSATKNRRWNPLTRHLSTGRQISPF